MSNYVEFNCSTPEFDLQIINYNFCNRLETYKKLITTRFDIFLNRNSKSNEATISNPNIKLNREGYLNYNDFLLSQINSHEIKSIIEKYSIVIKGTKFLSKDSFLASIEVENPDLSNNINSIIIKNDKSFYFAESIKNFIIDKLIDELGKVNNAFNESNNNKINFDNNLSNNNFTNVSNSYKNATISVASRNNNSLKLSNLDNYFHPLYQSSNYDNLNAINDISRSIIYTDEYSRSAISLPTPIFFDNSTIHFEFKFKGKLKSKGISKQVVHKLDTVNRCFHLSSDGNMITGQIDTGNNIGYFSIPLQLDGKFITISFYVLSVKLLSEADMRTMLKPIDEHYPFWRYSLSNPTTQNLDGGDHSKKYYFPLLWLSRFMYLREEFEKGLKKILANPHLMLTNYNKDVKIEKIHGKLPGKLEENIGCDKRARALKRYYGIPTKKSTIDTPENQFILYVVKKTRIKLENLYSTLKSISKHESKSFSSNFLDQFQQWCNSLSSFEKNPMSKGISPFTTVNSNSMVLQQKSGYSSVYRVWQELKFYLSLFGKDCEISLKTVSELYEIWCFLEVKQIVQDICLKKGFKEKSSKNVILKKTDLEYQLIDESSSFKFVNPDENVEVEIIHEYKTDKHPYTNKSNNLKSWTTTQKPDIILKFTFSDVNIRDEEFLTNFPLKNSNNNNFISVIWIFDAKYRIAYKGDSILNSSDSSVDDVNEFSFVPDDAINQMHRYRDSLIQELNSFSSCRSVIGAYALYPGIYDQKNEKNPYQQWIEKVNIGAFALLPHDFSIKNDSKNSEYSNKNNYWLYKFIEQTFNYFTKEPNNNEKNNFSLSKFKSIGSQLIFPTTMGTYSYKHLLLVLNLSNNDQKIIIHKDEETNDFTSINIKTPLKNKDVYKAFLTMFMTSLEYVYLKNNCSSIENNETNPNDLLDITDKNNKSSSTYIPINTKTLNSKYTIYQVLNCTSLEENFELSIQINLGLELNFDIENDPFENLEHLDLTTFNKKSLKQGLPKLDYSSELRNILQN